MTRIAAAVSLMLVAAGANALPVVGTSWGSFSNLGGCDNSGDSRDCRIVNTAANGSNTETQWGSTSSSRDFTNPSRLTAVDLPINANTDAGLGVAIGRLDWYNSPTLRLDDSLDQFSVRWTLSLNFTTPNGPDANGSEAFSLDIRNPINPTGDSVYGLGLADLTNLRDSFSLAGIAVSNLRYSVVDGAGAGTSWFANNRWYNDESNSSSLYILADFRSTVTSVPEPATLGLFGLGLLGVAFGSRRKAKSGAV